jgi:hypothetical protein
MLLWHVMAADIGRRPRTVTPVSAVLVLPFGTCTVVVRPWMTWTLSADTPAKEANAEAKPDCRLLNCDALSANCSWTCAERVTAGHARIKSINANVACTWAS